MKDKPMTDKNPNRTTAQEDWVTFYSSRTEVSATWQAPDEADFRNLPHASLMNLLARYCGGEVIEVGGGDSHLLIDIQKRFQPARTVGLDYLSLACKMLSERASHAGAPIEIVCADMFEPPSELLGAFDMVMSHGVVEHFTDLDGVIAAIADFAKPGGAVFTLIPNVKGSIYQGLMKRWSQKVYDAHVPYDATDLAIAHEKAGLKIESCAYFLSSNFGMLSWCFADRPKRGLAYRGYVWLTRLSKLGWWFERRFFPLPATRWCAPYIVCFARKV
jgi:2-polyprenyl-3-methyl-5-hydroxy-6-metoxy-1,4-benzoquinol methylase